MSDAKSASVMTEVFSALVDAGMEWRSAIAFAITARYKAHRKGGLSPVLELTLHRLQEKHDRGFLLDIKVVAGPILPALDLAHSLAMRIRQRIG